MCSYKKAAIYCFNNNKYVFLSLKIFKSFNLRNLGTAETYRPTLTFSFPFHVDYPTHKTVEATTETERNFSETNISYLSPPMTYSNWKIAICDENRCVEYFFFVGMYYTLSISFVVFVHRDRCNISDSSTPNTHKIQSV